MSTGKLHLKFLDSLNPEVKKLVYWRQPIESGIFMVSMLTILFSLACLSFISVVAYACLTLLCCTAGWRIYHEINRNFFNKSDNKSAKETEVAQPFQYLMNADLSFSEDNMQKVVKIFVDQMACKLQYLRRALLIENYAETAKFALLMYMLTVVGSTFNLLTLITLAFIVCMTWPKVYELYQPQIDQFAGVALEKFHVVWSRAMETIDSLPVVGKKKAE